MKTRKQKAFTLDQCHYISTKWLKAQGFLADGKLTYRDIEFISAGDHYSVKVVASITDSPVLILQFEYEGELKRVDVEMVTRRTNYGGHGSNSFYMKCPRSGRKAMKLFFYKGQVLSAKASELNYSSQICGNHFKKMTAKYGAGIRADLAIQEMNAPGFRKVYAGKLTKRYKKLSEVIRKGSGMDFTMEDLNRL